MQIVAPSPSQFDEAIALLKNNQLPVNDITESLRLFVAIDNGAVVGTVAAEHDHENALLRSLCTADHKKGSGLGTALVAYIEQYLADKGVQNSYLLTTTAADFFSKKHYATIDRSDVPLIIQQTSEFAHVCPASAIVMKKKLL